MADIAKFIEDIKAMTVLELNELVKAIEEEFGVSAAAPVEDRLIMVCAESNSIYFRGYFLVSDRNFGFGFG